MRFEFSLQHVASLGSCCCCDSLSYCTGVSKCKIITGFVLFLAGFIALMWWNQDLATGLLDLMIAAVGWLFSPVGQAILAVFLVLFLGRGIYHWISTKVNGETFRQIANTLQNLPMPVKVIGGALAVAAIAPFAIPALLPLLAGAGVAVAGGLSVLGAISGVAYAVRRGNSETKELIKFYGETLIADVEKLQKTVEDGFEDIKNRLQLMEDRIIAAIKRLEDKIDTLTESVAQNHRETIERLNRLEFKRHRKSLEDHNDDLQVER